MEFTGGRRNAPFCLDRNQKGFALGGRTFLSENVNLGIFLE
jgi:hypothetical protein